MILNWKEKNKKNGFTLIELVVVMAIFLLIMGAAVSMFVSIIQSQKKVFSDQQFLNQISYVQEYMSKAIRMAKSESGEGCLKDSSTQALYKGYIYLLTHPVTTSDGIKYEGIKFLNNSDTNSANNAVCQEFFLDTDGILKEDRDGATPVALTSTNIKFDAQNPIRFVVDGGSATLNSCPDPYHKCGASEADSTQPRITILMNVGAAGEPAKTIQMTISRRSLDTLQSGLDFVP